MHTAENPGRGSSNFSKIPVWGGGPGGVKALMKKLPGGPLFWALLQFLNKLHAGYAHILTLWFKMLKH